MPPNLPIKLAGLAANFAGLLRVLLTFVAPPTNAAQAEWLYLGVDLLFLFGFIGIYAATHVQTGILGLIGFVIALSGVAIIAGPESDPWGFSTYMFGSGLFLGGLAVFSVGALLGQVSLTFAPYVWIAAFVAALASTVAPTVIDPQKLPAILLGIGFVLAGKTLYRR